MRDIIPAYQIASIAATVHRSWALRTERLAAKAEDENGGVLLVSHSPLRTVAWSCRSGEEAVWEMQTPTWRLWIETLRSHGLGRRYYLLVHHVCQATKALELLGRRSQLGFAPGLRACTWPQLVTGGLERVSFLFPLRLQ